MTDLEIFQRDHGEEWNRITQSTAFSVAMQFLNISRINSIIGLSEDEIEKNGHIHLADLRGHLKHENDLMTLSQQRDFEFSAPAPTYPNPEQEAAEQARPPAKTKRKK